MTLLKRFRSAASGASAVEFAIMGPVVIGVMFGFFDVAFSLYVKNSFNQAIGAAAREVYTDPDRTNLEIQTDVNAQLSKYGSNITTYIDTATSGSVTYKIIRVTMDYSYKSPILSRHTITLEGESRAPILDYQL